MKIGILGSGNVGVKLAHGFLKEGYQVYIATRQPDSKKGTELKRDLASAEVGSFDLVAQAAELVVLCVHSSAVMDAITLTGVENLTGKIVIDTTNVLGQADDALMYAGSVESMAEQIQAVLSGAQVVKAFNTVGADTMYRPDFDKQKPTMFYAGNDSEAKKTVNDIITTFGWEPLDCGKLQQSRSLEAMAPVWINYARVTGTPHHAFKML